MLRALTNFLFRRKDPTRAWVATAAGAEVDLRRCTLGGVALGGPAAALAGMGRSENARAAAHGYFDWPSRGVYAMVENARLSDFALILAPDGRHQPFASRFLVDGVPAQVDSSTTESQLVDLLGEPFCRSTKHEEYAILFYEFDTGEVQFSFRMPKGELQLLQFEFNPELSDPKACKFYGVEKAFPNQCRRSLSAPDA